MRNIYKELEYDLGISKDYTNGDLHSWVHQGVLLLNSVLTVEEASPNSHAHKGWEHITDKIISLVSEMNTHCVFILWGSYAQKKQKLINKKNHLILTSPHPSPLSSYRGFFGSKPFSKANTYLEKNNRKSIAW